MSIDWRQTGPSRYCRAHLALPLALLAIGSPAGAQDAPSAALQLPTVRFFYYDAGAVEWTLSEEPEKFEAHVSADEDSRRLYETLTASVNGPPAEEETARQMTQWIESERRRFEQSRSETSRIRVAEGIVAYLRAHDFRMPSLIDALKRRSGALDVELIAVSLRDAQDRPTYQLKVVLVQPDIDIGKQGFNVSLNSPNVTYASATYALGVALYEVHEIINAAESDGDEGESEEAESLPPPDPIPGPQLIPSRVTGASHASVTTSAMSSSAGP